MIHDLIKFYQRDLRDNPQSLEPFGVTCPETIEHFHLGYCSGNALKAASDEQLSFYKETGLVIRAQEKLHNCIVMPVYANGRIVDLIGMRHYPSKSNDRRFFNWQKPATGLLGQDTLATYPEIILCDNPFLALHVRQYGYPNVVALRSAQNIGKHLDLLQRSGTRRAYIVSRKSQSAITTALRKVGIDAIAIPFPRHDSVPPRECFDIIGKVEQKIKIKLTNRDGDNLEYTCGKTVYKIDSVAVSGLSMRVRIRIRTNTTFLDKCDLASASSRQKVAKLAAGRVGLTSHVIEDHLAAIAESIDEIMTERPATVQPLGKSDKDEAASLLMKPDLLDRHAAALNMEGEDDNKRLAVLVAASRLLPKPLGGILRGSPSSGKSSLMMAVAKLLPESQVLYFSRLTPQSLFFMPKDLLLHRLMVVDEYEGLASTEYPLRTMMSSQVLSLAITSREGGKHPVTKMIEIPATVAILVSATTPVNVENLSRFVEMRMDSSAEQTRRVLAAMTRPQSPRQNRTIINAQQLLEPCRVVIPYASKLKYDARSVLARRQFQQVLGLIQAHAALHQRSRKMRDGIIVAEKADYAAVYPLLSSLVTGVEESVSPSGMELLKMADGESTFTVRSVMEELSWSYSKAYRALQELSRLNLMKADHHMNGVERRYEVAPYATVDHGVEGLPVPAKV